VRKQVAAALGGRDDGEETGDRALAGLLGKDSWPLVRRATAGALGRRCGRSQPAARALFDAVAGDDDTDVRIAALSALTDCRAAGVGDFLLKIADEDDYPPPLRVRAATLIGALEDPRYCKRAVDLFERRRRETWNSAPALQIAAAAAGALGVLGCDEATDPLVGAATDDAFPELQAAAVTALGQLCPRGKKVRALFDRLAGSDHGRVALAARSARAACARKVPR
jgi:HEAT repeat protein